MTEDADINRVAPLLRETHRLCQGRGCRPCGWTGYEVRGAHDAASSMDAPDARDRELERAREENARLRYSLSIFVHAHASGHSVPPHLENAAREALKGPTP